MQIIGRSSLPNLACTIQIWIWRLLPQLYKNYTLKRPIKSYNVLYTLIWRLSWNIHRLLCELAESKLERDCGSGSPLLCPVLQEGILKTSAISNHFFSTYLVLTKHWTGRKRPFWACLLFPFTYKKHSAQIHTTLFLAWTSHLLAPCMHSTNSLEAQSVQRREAVCHALA